MKENKTKKMSKTSCNYFWELCHFKCYKKNNYTNHLLTRKDINTTNYNQKTAKILSVNANEIKVLTNWVLEVIKTNTELQKQNTTKYNKIQENTTKNSQKSPLILIFKYVIIYDVKE